LKDNSKTPNIKASAHLTNKKRSIESPSQNNDRDNEILEIKNYAIEEKYQDQEEEEKYGS